MKTSAAEEVYGAVNIAVNNHVEFQICLSDAETEATTWSIADTDHIVNKLEREIYNITSKDQLQFKKEFLIHLVEFEAWWQAIIIQELWKTIQQRIIHFRYSKLHLVTHISDPVQQMGSGDNFTTDISESQYISNVKEVYQFTNKVNYI
jgi:hypothetical protein